MIVGIISSNTQTSTHHIPGKLSLAILLTLPRTRLSYSCPTAPLQSDVRFFQLAQFESQAPEYLYMNPLSISVARAILDLKKIAAQKAQEHKPLTRTPTKIAKSE
jgi:hypothetical protein